jgi:hypothetical protein
VAERVKEFEERLVQSYRALIRKGYGSVKINVDQNKPVNIEVLISEK